MLYMK